MFCFPHPTEEWTGLLCGSGPDKIMRIRADPDTKHCLVESHFYKSWLTILILGTTASLRP